MVPSWTKRIVASLAIGFVAAAAALLGSALPASAADTSSVSIVHGIPGQPVDVYVNGAKTLSNFQPATIAGPLDLKAGSYDVALTKPGEPVSAAILSAQGLAVPAGKNLSLVAHLSASGKPTLTAFVNDTSAVGAGKARIVVRHTAAAPAVDVRANGQTIFSGLTNPNEASAVVPAGTYKADVVLAGTSTVVIGPASLDLAAGTSTIVYAIGSATDKSLAVVVQTIRGLGGAPSGVPAGTGGLAADHGLSAWWPLMLAAGALLIIGGGARLTVTRRRTRT
jgi:hypothetical protein